MAKNNNNKKKGNGGNRPNFFTKQIQQGGENFLDNKDINTLLRDAKNVFRDLAHQSINIEKYYNYFLNGQFINALIQAANDEFFESSMIYQGIEMQIHSMSNSGIMIDPRVIQIREKWALHTNAYRLLCEGLGIFSSTQNPNDLVALSRNLAPYKYNI